jgi:inner membrane protein
MTGKTHQIIGLTAGLLSYLVVASPAYAPATLAAVGIASHFAALLPDIDQPAASIWHGIPFGHVVGEVVNPFLQHRNLSHSFLGLGLFSWGMYVLLHHLPPYWGIHTTTVFIAAVVAYASHMIADMVTVEGIPLFFPNQRMYGIPPRPLEGLRILTGHWFENLIVFPLCNFLFLELIYAYWPLLRRILFH